MSFAIEPIALDCDAFQVDDPMRSSVKQPMLRDHVRSSLKTLPK